PPQKRREPSLEVETHLILAAGLNALHRREENAHRQLVLRVQQPREREDDVLSGERLTIVEDGIVDEVEEPGLVVLLLPRLCEPRDELTGFVHVGELV